MKAIRAVYDVYRQLYQDIRLNSHTTAQMNPRQSRCDI